MKSAPICIVALVVAGLAIVGNMLQEIFAADVVATWGAVTSGNWNVDANWTNMPALGGFPNNGNGSVATYSAAIGPAGSPYTVTLSTNVTVENLVLNSVNATLSQTSGTFSATGAITLSAGTYQLLGGTISNTTLNETGGTLAIGANSANLLSGVTVNGDLSLNTDSGHTRLAGGTTFNTPHLAQGTTSLGFAPGQTLSSTILFEGAAAGTRAVELNGTAGTFTVGPTGVIRTATGFGGDAQMGPGFWFGGGAMALANQGLVASQVSGRTVNVSPDTLTNSSTGILEATNGGILTIAPLNGWTNSGTIHITSATLNLNGTFNATGGIGTWNNSGGTVNINGTINNTGNTLTLNSSTGSWNLTGGTLNGGTLSFADGKTLVVTANNGNLLNGVTVNGDLALNTDSGRTKLAGGTTFNTAHLAQGTTSLGFAPGQTLSSTILFEGAAAGTRAVEMNGTAGTFTVGPTGVIRTATGFGGDAQMGPGFWFGGGAMALANQGLVASQVSGRTVTVSPDTLTNSSTGILEATNGGILTIAPLNGWTNSGTIHINSATVNLNGTFNATGGIGTWNNTSGTVNLNGTLNNTGNTLTLNNSTGSWSLTGGTINGGTLSFADGKTLVVTANNGNLLNGVAVNGDLSLNTDSAHTRLAGGTTFNIAHLAQGTTSLGFAPGQTLSSTILFEGAAAGTRAVELNGTAGTFTVGPTGVIRTATGFGGDAQMGPGFWFGGGAMALANQGLISSQVSGHNVTINPATGFGNSGTLEAINGGNLAVPMGYTQSAGVTRVDGGSMISAVNPSGLSTIAIEGGRLEGSGTMMANVVNSATISPGLSAGTLAITGNLSLASTSMLQIEIGGTAPGTQYDQLHVTGQLAAGGTLNVSLINNFNLSAGNVFDFLDGGSITGKFSAVQLPVLTASLSWYTAQLYNHGRAAVIDNNFLPGDFNRDGHITAADIQPMVAALTDLNAYKTTNGLTSAQLLAIGDIDLSGTVDNNDLHSLLKLVQSGGGLLAVPEPATGWLLLAGTTMLAGQLGRRGWQVALSLHEDGRLLLDNNASKRPRRHQAIGRKDWLLLGSSQAGRRAAI